MDSHIRPYTPADPDALVELTLRAFEPVFASFARILGPAIFPIEYPDWRKTQADLVVEMSRNDKLHLAVAEVDGQVAGFIAYEFHENETGEVYFLAVHPDYQNQGVGTELNLFALERLKEGGAKLAVVGTGGDESHAPARRSYEKVGYTALPLVRYYKSL
jgi:ribosomal protein S18 acetylase RimI-like enzyme